MSRTPFPVRLARAVVVFACLLHLAAAAQPSQEKPNIIVFFTDDQGWTDTSVPMRQGDRATASSYIRTPHLERLARQGMVFSSGYSASPVCSPSRDSLLYGQTPTRLQHSILLGTANAGPDSLTIPRAVKSADASYVTAHFGKWACTPKTPEEVGFDESDGNNDNWHGDWRRVDGEKMPLPDDDPKRIFSVTQKAMAFLDQQAESGRPFYLRVSHYAVHVGNAARPETIQRYLDNGLEPAAAVYAAMAEDLDTGLGMLLDKVKSLGLEENTYFLFTSDNGGGFGSPPNRPLRGSKASLWEGGIRVPFVVRGPGIEPGTCCEVSVAAWDLLPTFYDLAGGEQSLPKDLDGGSLRSLFENGDQGKVRRNVQPLMFHYPWFDSVPMSAIRSGDYKLVKDLNTDQARLFNLAEDLGESRDLSATKPGLAKKLRRQLDTYLSEVGAEDLEELREQRESNLNAWINRDTDELNHLQQRAAATAGAAEREAIQRQIEDIQRRIQGHKAALERVARGRELTAW